MLVGLFSTLHAAYIIEFNVFRQEYIRYAFVFERGVEIIPDSAAVHLLLMIHLLAC